MPTQNNKVCPECKRLVRHCRCGRFARESRHFDDDGNKIEDTTMDEFKEEAKGILVKHGVNLGHDLLDRVGEQLIGKKGSSKEQKKDRPTTLKECAFCGKKVSDLSTHRCEDKDKNVIDAEYEVVDEDGRE